MGLAAATRVVLWRGKDLERGLRPLAAAYCHLEDLGLAAGGGELQIAKPGRGGEERGNLSGAARPARSKSARSVSRGFRQPRRGAGRKPGNLLPNDLGEIGHLKPLIDRLASMRPEFLARVTGIVGKIVLLTEDVTTTARPSGESRPNHHQRHNEKDADWRRRLWSAAACCRFSIKSPMIRFPCGASDRRIADPPGWHRTSDRFSETP